MSKTFWPKKRTFRMKKSQRLAINRTRRKVSRFWRIVSLIFILIVAIVTLIIY